MLSVSAVLTEDVAKFFVLGGVLETPKGEGGGVIALERIGNGKSSIGGWLSVFGCSCGGGLILLLSKDRNSWRTKGMDGSCSYGSGFGNGKL